MLAVGIDDGTLGLFEWTAIARERSMGKMMVVMPESYLCAWIMKAQLPRQVDTSPPHGMVLAGLHVIQLPGFQEARELSAPVAHDPVRRQPVQGIG